MKNFSFILIVILILHSLCSCNRSIHKKATEIEGSYQLLRIEDEPLNDSTNISGYVTSKSDSIALPGVHVFTINPITAVETDHRGYFEVTVKPGTYEFGAQYVGFDSLKIPELICFPNERIIILIELGTTIHHIVTYE